MRTQGTRTTGSTLVMCVLGALLLAQVFGCTDDGHDAGSPSRNASSSTATTPAADSSVAAATEAAVAAYNGYIQAFGQAAQTADPDDPNLSRYAADPLLSLTRHNLRTMKDRGQVQIGAQTATVTSTQADLASAQPAVTVHACLDYSSIKLVYASNRSPVPNSEIKDPRVSAIATVWLYQTGQWLVNDTKQGNDPC
ncbi:MAG: hypothetical protein JXA67_02730 [Micromonosporaceae bacterium]|nr:hypothetical protein [Micromonosporaceae bacterium]